MKLTCSRQALGAAFQVVSGVVPSRTPKEILKNIKLVVADGTATLLATDQEVGVRREVADVATDSAGEVLLPTQRMAAILREVQEDTLRIEVAEEALWVRAGHSEFRLSALDPAEFPDIPTFADENYYVLVGQGLRQGIQRTNFACDLESSRYALGGVLMDMHPEQATLAATDGRRLAVYRTPCSTRGNVSEEIGQPVVPSKAMALIERSIDDDDQEVCLAVHHNDLLVRSGSTTIYARLVEGRFPRYQDVIPRESQVSIDLVAGPLLSVIRQAMIVTDDDTRGVDFDFGSGMLTLTSVGKNVGSSTIELPIGYDGEPVIITFDPKFIQDFLRVLDPASSVTLKLIDSNSAAVFLSGENYSYVVMPLSREK